MKSFDDQNQKLKESEVLEKKQIPPLETMNNQYKNNNFMNLFQWKMNDKELKYQVDNYKTLSLFRSAKGIAASLMILSAVLSVFFISNGWSSLMDIAAVLVLALFIYKGNKTAIVIAMIYWTFSKILQIISIASPEGNSSIVNIWSPILFWTIWMAAFWQAYQVETERRKTLGNTA